MISIRSSLKVLEYFYLYFYNNNYSELHFFVNIIFCWVWAINKFMPWLHWKTWTVPDRMMRESTEEKRRTHRFSSVLIILQHKNTMHSIIIGSFNVEQQCGRQIVSYWFDTRLPGITHNITILLPSSVKWFKRFNLSQ